MKKLPTKEAAQLAELCYLRDVVIPYMERPGMLVDLGEYESEQPCGTYRCLLGWYTFLRHGQSTSEWCNGSLTSGRVIETFGGFVFASLFGTVGVSGTLSDRKARLNAIIAERMA